MTKYIFEKIIFKKIELNKNENIYFVFDNERNMVEIEARNVCEAILKSKILNPVMVKNMSSAFSSSGILKNEFF